MNSGLLWYDETFRPLDEKINQAVARYQNKFGTKSNICFVNPSDLKQFAQGRDPLTYKMPCMTKPEPTIMPNYVWFGRDDA